MLELHFDDFTAMTKAPEAQLFLPIMQRLPKALGSSVLCLHMADF
jgi:hypothetical protein